MIANGVTERILKVIQSMYGQQKNLSVPFKGVIINYVVWLKEELFNVSGLTTGQYLSSEMAS